MNKSKGYSIEDGVKSKALTVDLLKITEMTGLGDANSVPMQVEFYMRKLH